LRIDGGVEGAIGGCVARIDPSAHDLVKEEIDQRDEEDQADDPSRNIPAEIEAQRRGESSEIPESREEEHGDEGIAQPATMAAKRTEPLPRPEQGAIVGKGRVVGKAKSRACLVHAPARMSRPPLRRLA